MDTKEVLIQWFANVLIKSLQLTQEEELISIQILRANNYQKNNTRKLIKNFKKRIVFSPFKDNIWTANLADIQLISKYNRGTRYFFLFNFITQFLLFVGIRFLCVIDVLVNMHEWLICRQKRYYITKAFTNHVYNSINSKFVYST